MANSILVSITAKSAQLSLTALVCYSVYAFASAPIINSEPAIHGPLVRIAVFFFWLFLAWTFALAQESLRLHQGLIGCVLPGVLLVWELLATAGTNVPPLEVLQVLCQMVAYGFVCGMFAAAIPESGIGAFFTSIVVLVVQVGSDYVLSGFGAYGRIRFNI